MLFSFWLNNHSEMGQRSLEDVIGILGHQLRALGHQAIWDPKFDKFILPNDGINVIVEGFTAPVLDCVIRAHDQGARFLILATEEPSLKGFNHGTQPEMVRRQQMFPHVAKFADAIFHLVPGQHVTDWYGQFAPTAQVELGYAPTIVRKPNGLEPEYDFGFYGSMTKRRMRLLRRLARRSGRKKAVRIVSDFTTQDDRDKIMREAKVIVQIRKFEEMGLVSSSRCNTALCLGRPVIAEPHLLSHPWDEVVKFAGSEDAFLNSASLMVHAWKRVHAEQFDKFKKLFTPEYCVGRALDKVGLLREKTVCTAA